MKTYLVLLTLIALFGMISCGPVKEDSEQTPQETVSAPGFEQTAPENASATQPTQNETALQSPAGQKNTGAMLNPPHGEPFHRCDIPVGAPLSSAPTNAKTPTTNNQVKATTPQPPASAPVVVKSNDPTGANTGQMNPAPVPGPVTASDGPKPKLNPAHGQPHHRCDIAVGSPLP